MSRNQNLDLQGTFVKVAVTSQSSLSDFEIPSNGPWESFFRELGHGNQIVSIKEEPEALLSMNVHPALHRSYVKKFPKKNRVLILWEPFATNPSNFKREFVEDFGFIFSPSKLWSARMNHESHFFHWPVGDISEFYGFDWAKRSSQMAAFFSNKVSIAPGEMYSFRRRCVKDLSDSIDLYGSGWEKNSGFLFELGRAIGQSLRGRAAINHAGFSYLLTTPSNYKGYVKDKDLISSQHRFVLVIENSMDYVSEKLFDVLRVGAIPIYVGAPLQDFGVPNGIAITVPPEVKSILGAYEDVRVDEKLCKEMLEKGREFLSSKSFKSRVNTTVLASLGRTIREVLLRERY